MTHPELKVIGWREWLALPQLGIPAIKAKIDTGARSASLHAFDMEYVGASGKQRVRFLVHPEQRNVERTFVVEADILEFREVRSSNGLVTRRPVIMTQVRLFNEEWMVELTLANRDQMGFRMLLGREALRRRFLVDSHRSYLAGKRPKRKR